jgi:DNA polymerase sigma
MELQWTDGGLKADDIPSAKKRKTAEHHGPDEYHRFEESPSLVLPRESIDSVAWLANVPQSSSVSVSQEAEELLQYLKPTPAESKAREDLLLRLTLLVQELFPWSQLQVFGSTQTDLLLPLSDLDVIIAHVIENMSNVDQLILKIDTSGIAVPGTIRVVPARVRGRLCESAPHLSLIN